MIERERRHTPPPWAVREAGRSGRYEIEAEAMVACPGSGGAMSYTDVVAATYWMGTDEWKANADLIAAAPALLEALERIESNIGWRGKPADDLDSDFFCCEFCGGQATDPTDVPHHDECLVYVVRAAIAKAKGQDHD